MSLITDEVHIKDDLVYDKHSGVLVGFENLGETNNQAALSGDTVPRPLAKTMLVLMVRGLFTNLRFPYAQFPYAQVSQVISW